MIWTFFYGLWINLDVLKEEDLSPEHSEVAILHGYEIQIQQSANILRHPSHLVYGVLLATTADKHHRIVKRLIDGSMGHIYLPEAVLVETLDRRWKPAICYIATSWEPHPLNVEYYEPFLKAAKDWKFPSWYIKHLESFRK
jgi:hypothetical protein